MNVEIITTENFRREAKRLFKKYPSLKSEFDSISDNDLKKLIKELREK